MKNFAIIFLMFFFLHVQGQINIDTLYLENQEQAVQMGEFLHNFLDSTAELSLSSEQGAIHVAEGKVQIRFVNYELVCTVSRYDLVIAEKSFRTLPSGARGQIISATVAEYHFAGEPKRGYFICDLQSLAGQDKEKAWMAEQLLISYRQQILSTIRAYRSARKKFRNDTFLIPIK